jgi:hypothetical protein
MIKQMPWKIARLHMAGMLPESHLLDREEQVKRDLLTQRVKLGVEIGDVKRQIISYLKREDVCITHFRRRQTTSLLKAGFR